MHKKEHALCIHGHFYQPPRENPWIEEIEIQPSAYPNHDWNERVYQQSYLPSTMARVLDEHGQITDIVNNFEKISFNIGPTLFSWIEKFHPETYRRIVDADLVSRQHHHGHGNAIAQVYNHMIMPLANRKDKETQVIWGMQEFRYRFNRNPESIWLPETACNEETLEVLINHGMRFVILAPHQAQAIRKLGEESNQVWHDVSNGEIDPKQSYRFFLTKDRTRHIDIFFYDGPISKEMGFGDLLFESRKLMDRIQTAETDHGGLIHMATDGETYGHHKAFGERALAYALNVESPKRGYRMVNYAEYLNHHPPRFEVRIKEGENEEGTSWSCAHGVRRWKDHCGCRGEGPAEWTQHWRKPLRESLDWLRDELYQIYQEFGSPLFHDVWKMRDEYIDVILDRNEAHVMSFLRRHSKQDLSPSDIVTCLKLLEMQRHALLMYTSCGWFFTDISGIETVQVLTYAARAIEYAREISQTSLEEEFMERLARAKGNHPEFSDGRIIYEKLVKTRAISLPHLVSYYAIASTISDDILDQNEKPFFGYRLHVVYQRKESFGSITLNYGRIKFTSTITLQENDYGFIVAQMGAYDFRCSLKPYQELSDPEALERELLEELQSLHIVEILRKIDDVFGERYFALRDLPLEQRMKIISILSRDMLEKVSRVYETLYDENRQMNEIYRSISLPLPPEIRYAAEHTLIRRLQEVIHQLAEQDFNIKKSNTINRIIKDAKAFKVELNKYEISELLSKELDKRADRLMEEPTVEIMAECINLFKLAKKINVELEQRNAQDKVFFLIKSWKDKSRPLPPHWAESQGAFEQFLNYLAISPAGLNELTILPL